MAMTTPPSGAGWTIQFMPRSCTSAGGGAAGSWAFAVARNMALRIAATSSGVQAAGSVGWTMVSVNTWLLPRNMISTVRRIDGYSRSKVASAADVVTGCSQVNARQT